MKDPKQHEAAAEKLLGVLTQDPAVAAGKRQLHFFVGHGDTANPSAQGAAGGDGTETEWNQGVLAALRKRALRDNRQNFVFHDPIIANDDQDPNANWNRAQTLRRAWIEHAKGAKP